MSTTTRERAREPPSRRSRRSPTSSTRTAPRRPARTSPQLKNRMEEIDTLKEQVKDEAEAQGAAGRRQGVPQVALRRRSRSTPHEASTRHRGRPADEHPGQDLRRAVHRVARLRATSSAGTPTERRHPERGQGHPVQPVHTADIKALVTGASATSAGAAVRNDLYAPITDLVGERELTVCDLVTKGSTTSDTVEYVRVTAKTNAAAPAAEATSARPRRRSTAPRTRPSRRATSPSRRWRSRSCRPRSRRSPTGSRSPSGPPATPRQVRTLVDNFLRYGLNEELEDQMLTGAGTG